ncbi:MAG: GDP-mannose 4,6-dehydratase [bacterium]|nr:GDP-mannose 4,6-dehydratase [bacterium]
MRALITGVAGQDGSYLTELLLSKGYEVHGVERKSPDEKDLWRIRHLLGNKSLVLHTGDVTDHPTVRRLVEEIMPDEVYHLAAVSSIPESFQDEFGTFTTNISSTHYFLAALKESAPKAHFYFSSSADCFGKITSSPQNENTPYNPTSPYGVSKIASFYLTKLYREAHGLFACSGIMFSHESPRRGANFVTRKITTTIAKIKAGTEKELRLGNLDSRRDWGFAGDYVEAMWLMLQAPVADDYVVGTGETHTIREFVEAAFAFAGLDWEKYVVIDQSFFRPIEAHEWRADSTKIRTALGWRPKAGFADLVRMMVEEDMKRV